MPTPFWTSDDAIAGRCSVAAVGFPRPVEVLDVLPLLPGTREDAALAQRYAPRAMAALARLMEGEGRAAVEAAREVLARAYGPPVAPVSNLPPANPGALPAPEWLEPNRRLNYQDLNNSAGDNPGMND